MLYHSICLSMMILCRIDLRILSLSHELTTVELNFLSIWQINVILSHIELVYCLLPTDGNRIKFLFQNLYIRALGSNILPTTLSWNILAFQNFIVFFIWRFITTFSSSFMFGLPTVISCFSIWCRVMTLFSSVLIQNYLFCCRCS